MQTVTQQTFGGLSAVLVGKCKTGEKNRAGELNNANSADPLKRVGHQKIRTSTHR